ncbi:hypothetical protein H2200_007961 [Cladophialophora chaetospira]|uniref:Cupin type-2 domain-containing protein n=1 Tax=Cladophialophora chaetospira TaxID=386627 RepID=A0AA38X6R6_9EURO|nr:hypothetical protein H2200_007961 [Cladophialophora chaetospira]
MPTENVSTNGHLYVASGLRAITRHITIHDEKGTSKFLPSAPPMHYFDRGRGYVLSRVYSFPSIPVALPKDHDLTAYLSKDGDTHPSSFTNGNTNVLEGGVNFIVVDMDPGSSTPLHRTVSVDLVVVIEGRLGLWLESGEAIQMGPGDMVVQRGTMHKWANLSDTESVRFLGVVTYTERIQIGGKPIERYYDE